MTEQYILVFCTCPDDVMAGRLAETLVRERLAACVNRIPRIDSTYWWRGKVQTETEALLLIKTRQAGFDALARRIRELHPYEVPEIVAVSLSAGLEPYLAWMGRSLAPPEGATE